VAAEGRAAAATAEGRSREVIRGAVLVCGAEADFPR
jgi:hypothetical protein